MTVKELRAYRKANKLCTNCGKPLDREGSLCRKCCDNHTSYVREAYHYYQEHGICPRCGTNKLYGTEKVCPECRAKETAYRSNQSSEKKAEIRDSRRSQRKQYSKSVYEHRKSHGICVYCGKRKVFAGRIGCLDCLEKRRERMYGESDILVDKQKYKILHGICPRCGKQAMEGKKLCPECYEKHLKTLEKAWESNRRTRSQNGTMVLNNK